MALPLKSGADLYTQELLRARLHNFDGDLAEYGTGSIYFNTTSGLNTSDRIRYRGLTNWHSVANLEDIARLEEMIGNLDFAGSEDFIGITSRVAALEGNFTNGAAKDAVKFGGQLPSYYATQSAFSALQDKVNAFLDGDVDSDAVLENLKEIQAFLDSYDGATSLVDLLDAKADKSQLSGYLPLSGGTLTGALYIEGGYDSKLIFNNTDTDTNYNQILFQQDGSLYGVLGTNMDGVLHWNYSPLLHAGNIRDYAFTAQAQITNNTDADTLLTNGVYLNATGNGSGNSNFPSTYGILMTFTQDKNYSAQISVGNGSMHVRRKLDAWSDWKTVAFTDSDITGNAASATKLQTARSLWGNSFDGTADINGDIHLAADKGIVASNGYAVLTAPSYLLLGYAQSELGQTTYLDGNDIYFRYGKNHVLAMCVNASGSVGIGTDNPLQKLHVAGNILLRNYDSIRFFNAGGTTQVESLTLNSDNEIVLGGDANYYGLNTVVKGYRTIIKTGTYSTSALIIDENCNAAFSSRLLVGGASDDGTNALQVYGKLRLSDDITTSFYSSTGATFGARSSGFAHAIAQRDSQQNVIASIGFFGSGDTLSYIFLGPSYYSTWARFSATGNISNVLHTFSAGALVPTGQTLKIGDATLSWDSTSNALKVDKDFYSDGQVSSGGVAEEGTGGAVGGSGLERVVFTIPANTTTFDCVHNLGTREISVAIYEEGNDYQQILTDVYLDSTNIARVVFGSATDVAHKVVIIG